MKRNVHEKYSEALDIQSRNIAQELRTTQAELSYLKQVHEQLELDHSHNKKVINRLAYNRAFQIQKFVRVFQWNFVNWVKEETKFLWKVFRRWRQGIDIVKKRKKNKKLAIESYGRTLLKRSFSCWRRESRYMEKSKHQQQLEQTTQHIIMKYEAALSQVTILYCWVDFVFKCGWWFHNKIYELYFNEVIISFHK